MSQNAIPFFFDGGNAWVKALCGAQSVLFPHAVAPLAEGDYQLELSRGKRVSPDLMLVGGQSYAVGNTALASYQLTRLRGAAKYTREYYGLLFAAAVAHMFPDPAMMGKEPVFAVMASHSSKDKPFHELVMRAIGGRWRYMAGGKTYNFLVKSVETYEEPFGGYANLKYVSRVERIGKRESLAWSFGFQDRQVAVLDVGGGTTGVMLIDADGEPIYGASDSVMQGVNDVMATLERLLQQATPREIAALRDMPTVFRTSSIPHQTLQQALRTGEVYAEGRAIDVSALVNKACNPLLNEVSQLYRAKNLQFADTIIMTGGGCALLDGRLRKALNHQDMQLASPLAELQFANVRGAEKFWTVRYVAG